MTTTAADPIVIGADTNIYDLDGVYTITWANPNLYAAVFHIAKALHSATTAGHGRLPGAAGAAEGRD